MEGVVVWTRTGTWEIASSHEPTSGGATSCLMAPADPAVVPVLLSGDQVYLWFIEGENQRLGGTFICFCKTTT